MYKIFQRVDKIKFKKTRRLSSFCETEYYLFSNTHLLCRVLQISEQNVSSSLTSEGVKPLT